MKQFILLWLCLAATAWGQYVPRPASSGVAVTDFDTLAELNTIVTDANLPALAADNTFTGQNTLALGTITTSKPFALTETWNEGSTVFKALTITVTDTASAGTARFMEFLAGANSKFRVDKSGDVYIDPAAGNGALKMGANGSTGTIVSNRFYNATSSGTVDIGSTALSNVVQLNSSTGVINNNGTVSAKWLVGTGSPESAVTATVGSIYSRTDGGANTSLYVKESGSGNTGWVAK